MATTTIGKTKVLLLALALTAAACGGGGGSDAKKCRKCSSDDDCRNDQECVLAVDNELRCFKNNQNSCTLDRVPVSRLSPIPSPTSTPRPE